MTRRVAWLLGAFAVASAALHGGEPTRPFRITVVDAASGRPVPLVELTTTSSITFVTDSAGVVAFDEPGLLGRKVWFSVRSHGYRYPPDGFGFAGLALDTTPGGAATIRLPRLNVAERVQRLTGAGIRRDSVLLGDVPPPAREPVMGQDSVQAVVLGERVLWFWGDTNRASYPLGNFRVTGATSPLPADPTQAFELRYFVDGDDVRSLCPTDAPGAVWLDGVSVAPVGTSDGIVAHYSRMKSLGERLEHGLVRWDPAREVFDGWRTLDEACELHPRGGPGLPVDGFLVFCSPYPDLRVPAASVGDPASYEGLTCLRPGTRFDPSGSTIERDAAGRLVWGWKRGTPPLSVDAQRELVEEGRLAPGEALAQLRDAATGAAVVARPGTVSWNAHRRRWVMIANQVLGTSLLGEVWYAESDELTGPWLFARKVVTHDDYSFYNVVEHRFLQRDGGRFVFFEGTYTREFSGTKVPTPRYDYNQVLYRLDVDDPRLHLPAPVYEAEGRLGTLETIGAVGSAACVFFARPPDRPGVDGVAVHASGATLHTGPPRPGDVLAFHALPAGDEAAGVVPLREDLGPAGERRYTIDEPAPGHTRGKTLAFVWRNPMTFVPPRR